MYVIGCSSHSGPCGPATRAHEPGAAVVGQRAPSLRAGLSSHQKPALWRVASYSEPGISEADEELDHEAGL